MRHLTAQNVQDLIERIDRCGNGLAAIDALLEAGAQRSAHVDNPFDIDGDALAWTLDHFAGELATALEKLDGIRCALGVACDDLVGHIDDGLNSADHGAKTIRAPVALSMRPDFDSAGIKAVAPPVDALAWIARQMGFALIEAREAAASLQDELARKAIAPSATAHRKGSGTPAEDAASQSKESAADAVPEAESRIKAGQETRLLDVSALVPGDSARLEVGPNRTGASAES